MPRATIFVSVIALAPGLRRADGDEHWHHRTLARHYDA
jgi:hypothetical protein